MASNISIGNKDQKLRISTAPSVNGTQGVIQIHYGNDDRDELVRQDQLAHAQEDQTITSPSGRDSGTKRLRRRLTLRQFSRATLDKILKGLRWTQLFLWVIAVALFSVGFQIYRFSVWIAAFTVYAVWSAIYVSL